MLVMRKTSWILFAKHSKLVLPKVEALSPPVTLLLYRQCCGHGQFVLSCSLFRKNVVKSWLKTSLSGKVTTFKRGQIPTNPLMPSPAKQDLLVDMTLMNCPFSIPDIKKT